MDSIVYFVGFEEKEMEKPAFEPTGLVPRSIIRTLERFRQQLLPEAEVVAVQEFRISRYQLLVSIKCLLTLLDSHRCESHCEGLLYKAGHRIFLEWSSNRPVFKFVSARSSIARNGGFFRKLFFESLIEEEEVKNLKPLTSLPPWKEQYNEQFSNTSIGADLQ
jgi:hypothetical protein